jgi:aminopeptidase
VPPWDRRRFRTMIEPGTASITIYPEPDPGVFDGLPAERLAADHAPHLRRLPWLRRAVREGRRRWASVAWPNEAWAAEVYPELGALEAQRRLGRELLRFCRLGPDDPPGFEGWTRHSARLAKRARRLTQLGLTRLELRGPGTHLDLALAAGTRWLGGRRENAFGRVITQNFPTEENFTSPDARETEGTFRCTRPRILQGRMIDGIAGEFRRGRLVRLEASHDDDRDLLAAMLDVDRGAGRLGEVALVDRSSRIGRAGRVYFNALLDENAAAHIAFGLGFGQTRLPVENVGGTRGLNKSSIHIDVMIGSDDLEATGVTAKGRRVPLIAEGTWQL